MTHAGQGSVCNWIQNSPWARTSSLALQTLPSVSLCDTGWTGQHRDPHAPAPLAPRQCWCHKGHPVPLPASYPAHGEAGCWFWAHRCPSSLAGGSRGAVLAQVWAGIVLVPAVLSSILRAPSLTATSNKATETHHSGFAPIGTSCMIQDRSHEGIPAGQSSLLPQHLHPTGQDQHLQPQLLPGQLTPGVFPQAYFPFQSGFSEAG